MEDLFAARAQMAISLGFHILFAVAGMAMPVLMVISEGLYIKTRDPVYLDLTKRWAKGTAILFAVGAVSGTVLSFELGLLWPTFMEHAGPLIAMPFSLEGFAFFIEAIFLGLYLYGWDRLTPAVHLACGVMVAISGLASGVFVVAVNAWMNSPVGFEEVGAVIETIDPLAPFRSPAFFTQATHMAIAAYVSVAFAVLGIHAHRLRADPDSRFHRAGLRIALGLGVVAAPLSALTGDLSAKHLAEHQPIKLAAAEAHFQTERGAGLAIGGWPNLKTQQLEYGVKIPYALSFLATGSMDGEVKGLSDFDRSLWPPVAVVHVAFQIMVGCGTVLLFVGALGLWMWRRRGGPERSPLFLRAAVLASPLGLIALEAGWTVTEVGRQPWIVAGVLRTADAVTPMPQLAVPLAVFTLLYLFLGVVVVVLLRAIVFAVPREGAS